MEQDENAPSVDVTELLLAWRGGDSEALARLMPLVYEELRSVAAGYLRRERSDHTLQATAVIHEAYLRMVERTHPQWQGRVHFFAVAAKLMRRILVDHARERLAKKRGGGAVKLSLEERDAVGSAAPGLPGQAPDILDLDAALKRLATFDERKARVLELRYFGGLTIDETAESLEVSEATVRLDSRLAKAWLKTELVPASQAEV